MRSLGSRSRFYVVFMIAFQMALIVVFFSGCATKPTKNKNPQNLTQNLTKVILNISSHADGYKKQKSVLSYWCKLESNLEPILESNLESSANLADNIDLDDSNATIDSPKSPDKSQDTTFSTKPSTKTSTTKSTPHKCKAIGGANAFFRAFGTSSFRAPRDEVVELEAGEYYLAAFEIETKKAIMHSCHNLSRQNPKDASKCGGWDYEANKPRFLSFSIGENATTQTNNTKSNPSPIVLPKVKIHLKDREQTNNENNANNAKSTKTKSSKKIDYEVVFIIEDFDKNLNEQDFKQTNDAQQAQQDLAQNATQDFPPQNFTPQDDTPQDKKSTQNPQNLAQNTQNHSHKAKSKRGNAIFSLGSSVRFEFADFANQKNDKNNQQKQPKPNKSQDNPPANIDFSENPTQDTSNADTQTSGI